MKLSNKTYDILKWVALIALPALQVFLVAIGKIWDVPAMVPTAATIGAIATLVGVCIGVSTAAFNSDTTTPASTETTAPASTETPAK